MQAYFVTLAILATVVSSFQLGVNTRFSRSQQVTTTRLQMAEVTPALVKQLREKSGAGMLDCRNALAASEGNLEGAVDWLRKKGLSAVAKKSGRVTSSGLVAVSTTADNKAASVIEMNSETDFVARNEFFQGMVTQIGALAATYPADRDTLLTLPFAAGTAGTVNDEITRQVATIGENMNLRRTARISVDNGLVTTYMHNPTKGNMGKIGVAVALESSGGSSAGLADLGKKIALHIAACSPEALTIAEVAPEKLEREKNVLIEQAKATGKPEAAIEKMVEGRIRKYYEEVVLLEQAFVMDGKVKISDLVQQTAKELKTDISLKAFVRFALGDGIEKAVAE